MNNVRHFPPTGELLTLSFSSVSSTNISWIRHTVGFFFGGAQLITFDVHSSHEERSLVYFSDNSPNLLRAYVDSGEGLDRAGGFAIQVCSHYTHPQLLELSENRIRAWVGYL